MRTFTAGLRYEFAVLRNSPAEFSWVFISPLYAVIFVSITEHAGRADLAPYAVLGPATMALVGTAIVTAGGLVDRDRYDAVLELEIASPASFPTVLVGRIFAVMSVGLITVVEAWLVAGVGFGRWVAVAHPFVFGVTLLLLLACTAAAATAMSAVFVLARSARIFQNSLSFPLFVLGGALVPVELLPEWLQPVSRLVFLSWATDLLRDATRAEPVGHLWLRWGVIATLGLGTFIMAVRLVDGVVRRIRLTGTANFA